MGIIVVMVWSLAVLAYLLQFVSRFCAKGLATNDSFVPTTDICGKLNMTDPADQIDFSKPDACNHKN